MISSIFARAANTRAPSLSIALENLFAIAMTGCWLCGHPQRNRAGMCSACQTTYRMEIEQANRTVAQHLYDVVYALALGFNLAAGKSLQYAIDRYLGRNTYGPTGIMTAFIGTIGD